ncbi:hypothetical protein [Corynebacterium sp.]|uniref:hypothetical protein n=1 Tax=Corynebacterium sp. TaxID=1720 RepID=UPI0026DBEABD|nr:hypothetical protein [Corynebacterium sp.]MDO5031928.1 hypothetical protein [Corynebacterium sp.]
MLNISQSADEQLFRNLVPPLIEWLQNGWDRYNSPATAFPSKGRENRSGMVCTTVMKDCFLENDNVQIGPAIVDCEEARSSLSLSIKLKAPGVSIVLRSDKTFDKSLSQPRPAARALDKEPSQFALFEDSDIISMFAKSPSKFAVVTWSWKQVPTDSEVGYEVRWDLKMYFSAQGDSVATARFKYGFKTSGVAGQSLGQLEAFIPTENDLQFIVDEDAEKDRTS